MTAGQNPNGTANGRNGQNPFPTYDVAIVGGGITGLSAAWNLQRLARDNGRPLSYTLLESGDRWGGKIKTDTIEGFGDEPFVIEGGPDSFITSKPWAWQLTKQLELVPEALPTNDDRRQTFVLQRGKPVPLPDGVMMIVPTRFTPFALSPLISPLGKLRMGLDLLIPRRKDGRDETLADFIRRRLGDEALDKIAEPLMSGIYNAEAEKQSVLATFPRFRDIEARYGSLIRGMLAAKRARASAPDSQSAEADKPASIFVSYRAGMNTLVDSLLGELDGDLRLNTAVTGMTMALDGYYELLTSGGMLRARAVILAVPAYAAAAILHAIAPDAAEALRQIRYVSTGTISLGFRRDEIDHPLNGFGIVIPRSERRPINAITWSSTKFDHRAPGNAALLRVFFGGSRSPEMMDKPDEELRAIVKQELAKIMGIHAEPIVERIYRWRRANPQYDVHHLERVAAIEAALPAGLLVAGSPYRGIGIPDCVHQGQQASDQVYSYLGEAERAGQTSANSAAALLGSDKEQAMANAGPEKLASQSHV